MLPRCAAWNFLSGEKPVFETDLWFLRCPMQKSVVKVSIINHKSKREILKAVAELEGTYMCVRACVRFVCVYADSLVLTYMDAVLGISGFRQQWARLVIRIADDYCRYWRTVHRQGEGNVDGHRRGRPDMCRSATKEEEEERRYYQRRTPEAC